MKVLVDSSVWIPFLRGHSELPAVVSQAMAKGESHLCPVIWVEIYSGIRGKREERIANELSTLCPSLPMDSKSWDEAAKLGRIAKRSGVNYPLADILIAACARRHGAELIHDDKHLASLLTL